MIIILSESSFSNNDTLDFTNSSGHVLRINKLQETFASASSELVSINFINLELYAQSTIQLSSIIGYENPYISITTTSPSLVGRRLDSSMLGSITINFFESEEVVENLLYTPTETLKV